MNNQANNCITDFNIEKAKQDPKKPKTTPINRKTLFKNDKPLKCHCVKCKKKKRK